MCSTMRAVEIRGSFGIENLTIVERPDPRPGPGEVLVRVRAASLNYRDLLMVEGRYNPKQPLPLVPCSDGVGLVEAVGEGVASLRAGDRVAGIFAQKWQAGPPTREKIRSTLGGPLDGTLRERMVLREEGLVKVPGYLTDEEAATLPCAAVTAWNALVVHGRIQAGQTVLVQGTGGVSLFALQIARAHGARVVVTSSSNEKLERARVLGAFAGVNYKKTADWGRDARDLTGGEGVDIVIEVGGAGTLEQSIKAVRVGGMIAVIGVLGGASSPFDVRPVLMQELRLQGVLVGCRETFLDMNRAFALQEIRPLIDRVFPLDAIRDALSYLRTGAHFGKIVVRL